MDRRAFIAWASAFLVYPLSARAQQPKVARIGVLLIRDYESTQARLRKELRARGYVEGKNILVEYRTVPAGQAGRLADAAAELARLKVDVIVAQFTPSAQAAKRATADIPIVMAPAGDPVGTGLIASLGRPGGNITGIASTTGPEFIGKLVQLMKELLPSLTRIAILVDTTDPFAKPFMEGLQVAASSLAIQTQVLVVRKPEEFDGAFAAMTRERAGAVAVHPIHATKRVAELAVHHRLPSFSIATGFVEAGGLMSYGVNSDDLMRKVTAYVDKILKGANPADLPVEHPTTFELAINRKTAAAINLPIPKSMLLRADQIVG